MLYPLFWCWLGHGNRNSDGIGDGANQYQNAAAIADSDSFHQNGKLNSSHSAPKRFALPRVYINNIGADRIVRCVRVMMSTHRSECFDCKSTLDWPNGADGITEAVGKCSKKRYAFNPSLVALFAHCESYYQIQLKNRQK